MILRKNGRKLVTSIELIVESNFELIAENNALRKELKWMLHSLEEVRSELAKLGAAVLARQQADQKVRELYRERDIAKANSANRGDGTLLH